MVLVPDGLPRPTILVVSAANVCGAGGWKELVATVTAPPSTVVSLPPLGVVRVAQPAKKDNVAARMSARESLVFINGAGVRSVGLERWDRTKEGGLPREKHVVERSGGVGKLGELSAIGDERGFDGEGGGDAITVFFDAIETSEFGLGERATIGVATGATREGFRVAFKTSAKGGAERADEAVVAFTEINLCENGFLGLAVLGGVGDVEEEVVVADFERRRVDAFGAGLAPVPDGMENGQAAGAEAFAAADAPVVFGGGGETRSAGFDLRRALLVEPIEAIEGGEFAGEEIAQCGQVPDVEAGVIEEFGCDGTAGPVGFLTVFIELDAEMFFEERREPDALAPEQLGGEHGVKNTFSAEAAAIVQEPQIEIAAVHHQMKFRETFPKRLEVESGRKGVDQENLSVDEKLQQANADFVMIHVVRLGIEGDFVNAVERRQQRGERAGLLDEREARRSRRRRRRARYGARSSGIDAEKTAHGGRQKTGNHLNEKTNLAPGKTEGECGNSGFKIKAQSQA